MTNKQAIQTTMGSIHLAWQVILFGVPLFFLGLLSFKQFDMGLPGNSLTISNYHRLLQASLFFKSLLNTFWLGFIVSLIATCTALVAVLCAWNLKWPVIRNTLLYACAIVFFIGLIPRTFVFQYLLSDTGPFSTSWQLAGFSRFPFQLYSFPGVVMGYLPVFIPLSVIILFIARKEIREEYIHAARELGAGPFTIQYSIIVPLLKSSIQISLVLVFLLTIADVVVIDLIGGSKIYTVSLLIIDYIKIDDWGMAAAASFIFLLVVLLFLFGISKLFYKKTGQ